MSNAVIEDARDWVSPGSIELDGITAAMSTYTGIGNSVTTVIVQRILKMLSTITMSGKQFRIQGLGVLGYNISDNGSIEGQIFKSPNNAMTGRIVSQEDIITGIMSDDDLVRNDRDTYISLWRAFCMVIVHLLNHRRPVVLHGIGCLVPGGGGVKGALWQLSPLSSCCIVQANLSK